MKKKREKIMIKNLNKKMKKKIKYYYNKCMI